MAAKCSSKLLRSLTTSNLETHHRVLRDARGRFRNPWSTWDQKKFSLTRVLRWKSEPKLTNLPSDRSELDQTLPLIKPNFSDWKIKGDDDNTVLKACWIGHATFLLRINGITVLTDPIFTNRYSPLKLFGSNRYRSPPCEVHNLPCPDVILISHNHSDHLCLSTCRKLYTYFGNRIQWFVPVGLASWLSAKVRVPISNVVELCWWQNHLISIPDIEIVCLPCQHWSMRNPLLFDINRTLWASWAVIGPKKRFYFSGDTGYCSVFSAIGHRYGPFDLAAIGIGNYEPRWFMQQQHCDPEQAVQIHKDLGAKRSVGIHWGTFDMGSTEFYLEPRIRLIGAVKAAGLDADAFTTQRHGEIVKFC